jgi:hypothetical protein
MSKQFIVEYPNFKPSFWGRNGHLQTVGSFFVRGPKSSRIPTRHIVYLADGDRLVIHDDQPGSWITGDRVAVLIHGLCGSYESAYIRRLAIRLRRHSIRTIRVDMRGFGYSTLISRGHFFAGASGDLSDVVKFVEHLSPLSKISLIGFSLGGNVVLKLLAELTEANADLASCPEGGSSPSLAEPDITPSYNSQTSETAVSQSVVAGPTAVDSAIVVSPPIDLHTCAANLRLFGNRIYDQFFTGRLARNLAFRRRRVKDLIDNGMSPIPDRLIHFDDQFTAPVNGFASARDYYCRCSTIDMLRQIAVPTIIVAAQDDPIIPFSLFDSRLFSTQIDLVTTRNGGHLGFFGNHPPDPDAHWLDWRICGWIAGLDDV